MALIDTEQERWGMLQFCTPFMTVGINPSDNDFDIETERYSLMNLYGGIAEDPGGGGLSARRIAIISAQCN